jgi:hypothetical protein
MSQNLSVPVARKLYRSALHPGQWIVHGEGLGWVIFPAHAGGWEERRNAKGLDPLYLREVPLWLAEDTGLSEAIRSTGGTKAA